MVSDQKTYDLMKKHVTSPDYGYKCECIPVASQHVKQHTVKSGEYEPTFSQVSLNMFLHEWQVIQVLYKFFFCEKKMHAGSYEQAFTISGIQLIS